MRRLLVSILSILALVVLGGCGKRGGAEHDQEAAARAKDEAESATEVRAEDSEAPTKPASLHEAARKGDRKVAAELLAGGAELEGRDKRGNTPLHLAVSCRQKAMVEYLIQQGADVKTKVTSGPTPVLYLAVVYGRKGDTGIMELLVEAGADVEAANGSGQTPLHLACAKGDTEIVTWLLANGAKPQTGDGDGKTALHYAGSRAVAELLIERGANVQTTTEDGRTPLHTVSSAEAMPIFLKHGAEVDARTNRKQTALHKLAEHGDKRCLERMKVLIASGADLDARDQDGNTPLHLAAEAWQGEPVVALLLAKGADPNVKNAAGDTPLQCATKKKRKKTMALFEKHASAK